MTKKKYPPHWRAPESKLSDLIVFDWPIVIARAREGHVKGLIEALRTPNFQITPLARAFFLELVEGAAAGRSVIATRRSRKAALERQDIATIRHHNDTIGTFIKKRGGSRTQYIGELAEAFGVDASRIAQILAPSSPKTEGSKVRKR